MKPSHRQPPAHRTAPRPDLPDWVPPVLVREWHVARHSRLTGRMGVTLHMALALTAIFSLPALHLLEPGLGAALVWTLIALVALVWVPLPGRASVAAGPEHEALEALTLTDLPAAHIVRGKWLGRFLPAVTLILSGLPWAAFVHWLGGLSFAWIGFLAAALIVAAGLVTALAAGTRAVLPAIVWLTLAVCAGATYWHASGGWSCDPADPGWRGGLAVFAALSFVTGWFALSRGTAALLPPSEQESPRRKMFALNVIVAASGLGLLAAHGWLPGVPLALGVICFTAVLSGLVALHEPLCEAAGFYLPWSRSSATRWFGRWLYPGWTGGVRHTLVLGLLVWAFIEVAVRVNPEVFSLPVARGLLLSGIVWVLLPVPLVWGFFASSEHKGRVYARIQVVLTLLGAALCAFRNAEWLTLGEPRILGLGAPLPVVAGWLSLHGQTGSARLAMGLILACVLLLVRILSGAHHVRPVIRRLEREAARPPDPPPAQPFPPPGV